MNRSKGQQRVSLRQLGAEPYRVFFPAGVLAGVTGVTLWPLHFAGLVTSYPGQIHARIMACGMFGGFIFGFLGTAMPRMLSASPLAPWQTLGLVSLHFAMTLCLALGKETWGDTLFLLLLAGFVCCMGTRVGKRKDLPPPGFVLVALAFLCVTAGAGLRIFEAQSELGAFWIILHRLLSYQGFVLLPILGIGPFLLPRFFGMTSPHDFPESPVGVPPGWTRKALTALLAGLLIIVSFFIEASGAFRAAHGLRFATTLAYLFLEMPFHRAPTSGNPLGLSIRIAFTGVLAGFLAVTFFPQYRVSLLHLTLVGGFAVITLVVATRVVFGHSGNLHRLKERNRWLLGAVGLMLFGMATRISGDFWPKIMASHYVYGAIAWIAGVTLWAAYVLPKVLLAESQE